MRPRFFRNLLSALVVGGLVLPAGAGAQDQPVFSKGQIVIWPSGAAAFPTGRFGKKDFTSDAPKAGNNSGFSGGISAGYALGQSFIVGVALDYTRFDLDLGTAAQNPLGISGHTSVKNGEAWVRYFVPGGFAHWLPFVNFGVGLGFPSVSAAFDSPGDFNLTDTTIQGNRVESDVDASVALTLGAGAIVPLGNRFGLSIEARARTVSSKGTKRTDRITSIDGDVFESELGSDPGGGTFRLKDKNNTDWWEIRGGLVFFLL